MFGLKFHSDMLRKNPKEVAGGTGSTGSTGSTSSVAKKLAEIGWTIPRIQQLYATAPQLAIQMLRNVGLSPEALGLNEPAPVSSGDPILDLLPEGAYRDPISGDYLYKDASGVVHKLNMDKLPTGGSGSDNTVGLGNLALQIEKFAYDKQQDAAIAAEDKRQYDLTRADDKAAADRTYDYNIKQDAAQLGLNYDQLNQKEQDDLRQLAYNYTNAGLDANAARQQALASLIANRNTSAVNLAQTSGDIAAQAAKFAANPRDAYSDVLFRNAVGGNTPYGSTSGANAAPAQLYQQGLDAKFQELFGGVGGDLSRARQYLDQPLPEEYTQPIQVQMPNYTPQTYAPQQVQNPAGGMTREQAEAFERYDNQRRMEEAFGSGQGDAFMKWIGGNASGGQVKVDDMKQQDPGKQMMEEHHITKTAPDGKKEVHTIKKSKPWEPKDSAPPQMMDVRGQMSQMRMQGNAAGGSQVLPEPTVLMGVSGKIYGTASENGPEMATDTGPGWDFTPMPGVPQQLDPQRQQQIINSVPGHAAGGTSQTAWDNVQAENALMPYRQTAAYKDEVKQMKAAAAATSARGAATGRDQQKDYAKWVMAQPEFATWRDIRGAHIAAGRQNAAQMSGGGAGLQTYKGQTGTSAPAQLGGVQGAAPGAAPAQLVQTNTPTPDALTSQITARLKAIDPQAIVQPGQTLPDLRLLSTNVIDALNQDSDLMELVKAAYSKFGISDAQFMDTIKKYRFRAPQNFQPSIRRG